jgi:hypothetical protein
MAYEKCVACGSSRLSPVVPVEDGRMLKAHFKVKDAPTGFWANDLKTLYLDRTCICGDCGYAALFVSESFDPTKLLPPD